MPIYLLSWNWLVRPEYVTPATWGLFFATAALVLWSIFDSKQKSREQRERWDREDALKKEESVPKADFGLKTSGRLEQLVLWCANLGTTTFLISEVRINDLRDASGSAALNKAPVIASAGNIVEMSLGNEIRKADGEQYLSVSITLKGPREESVVPPKVFTLYFYDGLVQSINDGFCGELRITCPKCNCARAKFKMDGLQTDAEFQYELAAAKDAFRGSCPDHGQSLGRLTMLPSDEECIVTEHAPILWQ